MRVLRRQIGRFEVVPRLGLILTPQREGDTTRIVHHVLPGSPAAVGGLAPYDIVLTVEGQPLSAVQHIVLSERRPSELTLAVWSPRYFKRINVLVRVEPEPFAPITAIIAAAERHLAEHPRLPDASFSNPRSPLLSDRLRDQP